MVSHTVQISLLRLPTSMNDFTKELAEKIKGGNIRVED